ncbi:MAG: FAD-dependent oxidoreductase [Acetobacteraceae bacterium]|nr:FAD-dependent oxidoreductase [Acetobacteraceae bacterium]
MSLSRRFLIHMVGKAGGVAAAYRTMSAMGLLPVPAAYAGPPSLPPGNGTKILILGAGIAGMVAAWELREAGYDCTILEARSRAGGRNWTLRAGDEILETDSVQRVRWDTGEHLYFNPGPARIPHHHEGILAYCRILGVKLEILCNDNRAAFMQDDAAFGGQPQRNRAVVNDSRGYVAELAAKAVDRNLLDQPVSTDDLERIRAFLRAFGALDQDLVYRGSSRAGYAVPPGAGEQSGALNPPLDLRQLLASRFWNGRTEFNEFFDQSATMLQPIGGMGQIGGAFGRKLFSVIRLNAEATQLRRTVDGARVIWKDNHDGTEHADDAAFVICTIPPPVLRTLEADFAPAVRAALAAPDFIPAARAAFLAERRFWELDCGIYGGITWTNRPSEQIWYPSAGIGQKKGVYIGAYIWSERGGAAFTDKPLAQRLSDTLGDTEAVHPGASQLLRKGVSVAWKKIPYNLGAWAEWSADDRSGAYATLLNGDGPFLFAGEHLSYINGWQEGAVRSAHYTLARLAERIQARR